MLFWCSNNAVGISHVQTEDKEQSVNYYSKISFATPAHLRNILTKSTWQQHFLGQHGKPSHKTLSETHSISILQIPCNFTKLCSLSVPPCHSRWKLMSFFTGNFLEQFLSLAATYPAHIISAHESTLLLEAKFDWEWCYIKAKSSKDNLLGCLWMQLVTNYTFRRKAPSSCRNREKKKVLCELYIVHHFQNFKFVKSAFSSTVCIVHVKYTFYEYVCSLGSNKLSSRS